MWTALIWHWGHKNWYTFKHTIWGLRTWYASRSRSRELACWAEAIYVEISVPMAEEDVKTFSAWMPFHPSHMMCLSCWMELNGKYIRIYWVDPSHMHCEENYFTSADRSDKCDTAQRRVMKASAVEIRRWFPLYSCSEWERIELEILILFIYKFEYMVFFPSIFN